MDASIERKSWIKHGLDSLKGFFDIANHFWFLSGIQSHYNIPHLDNHWLVDIQTMKTKELIYLYILYKIHINKMFNSSKIKTIENL
jgi:hypothetical protein